MSHGIIHARKHGAVHGLKHFVHPWAPVGPPSWTSDATSGIGIPQTSAEWDAVILDAGVTAVAPTSIYRCQEASGSLADSVGSFTLTIGGAGHSYQQAVAGWSSLGVSLTDGTVGSWGSTDAGLPDLATTSSLVLAYIAFPGATPGNTRNTLTLGTTSALSRFNITTGFLSAVGSTAVTGTNNLVNRVMPIWLKVDRTGSAIVVYSDQEVLTPAFNAGFTGKAFRLGSTGAAATVRYLYAARWDGVGAEWAQATIKAVSQSLGWTIPW